MKNKIIFAIVIAIMASMIAMPISLAQGTTNCNAPTNIDLTMTEVDCIQNMLNVSNKDDIAMLFPEADCFEENIEDCQIDIDAALDAICREYEINCGEDITKDELLKEITDKIQDTEVETAPIVSAEPTACTTPAPEADLTEITEVTEDNDVSVNQADKQTDDNEETETTEETIEVEVSKDVADVQDTEDATPSILETEPDTEEPTTTSAPQAPENTARGISTLEMEMIIMVNEDRANAGLSPLAASAEISEKAREHSQDMSTNNFFSHTSPSNGGFSERLQNSGLSYTAAGENIALYNSVEKAQAGLMASDGHRANILGENFTHVGIGIVWNEGKQAYYITQWFARQ